MRSGNPEEKGGIENLKTMVKWSFVIFAFLLVLSVSLGITPSGVRELNNFFFSLFIHDPRIEADTLEPQPTVSLSLDSMESTKPNQVESFPRISEKNPVAYEGIVNPNNPVRIVAREAGLDASVLNTTSTDLSVLNDRLLYGAVRYPESGDLEAAKNILVFGHSSELPVVHNQNFKIFNGLKKMSAGDEIEVYSLSKVYRYSVTSVRLVRAEDEVVTFANNHELILATCNVLGAKEERYVVRANFVGSYPIAS